MAAEVEAIQSQTRPTNGSSSPSPQSSTNSDPVISEIKRYIIEKDSEGSVGINIIGGTDQQHIPGNNSIFVAIVRRDDLANLIKQGDRIISINGVKLDGMIHSEAVQAFRDCDKEFEIVIETNAERRILQGGSGSVDGIISKTSLKSTTTATPPRKNDQVDNISLNSEMDYMTPPSSNSIVDGQLSGSKRETRMNNNNHVVAAANNDSNNNNATASVDGFFSLPSSKSSLVSTASRGSAGVVSGTPRTRNSSSSSTITYNAVQNESARRMGDSGGWRRIKEGDSGEEEEEEGSETAESVTVSSLAMAHNEGEEEEGEDGTRHIYQPPFFNSSQLMEIFFVGIGFMAMAGIAYIGYRRMVRGSWI